MAGKKNIRAKGPLGKTLPEIRLHYGRWTHRLTLVLTANGLNSFRNPAWGGWGGRYVSRQPYGESRTIWTQGGDWFPRVTSADTVVGVDGKQHVSDQATIWRWRDQFQNDFCGSYGLDDQNPSIRQNHHPVVSVNGHDGKEVIYINVKAGDKITLDASATKDPDGNSLKI